MYLLAYKEDDFSLPDVLTLGSPCFIIYLAGFGGNGDVFSLLTLVLYYYGF